MKVDSSLPPPGGHAAPPHSSSTGFAALLKRLESSMWEGSRAGSIPDAAPTPLSRPGDMRPHSVLNSAVEKTVPQKSRILGESPNLAVPAAAGTALNAGANPAAMRLAQTSSTSKPSPAPATRVVLTSPNRMIAATADLVSQPVVHKQHVAPERQPRLDISWEKEGAVVSMAVTTESGEPPEQIAEQVLVDLRKFGIQIARVYLNGKLFRTPTYQMRHHDGHQSDK